MVICDSFYAVSRCCTAWGTALSPDWTAANPATQGNGQFVSQHQIKKLKIMNWCYTVHLCWQEWCGSVATVAFALCYCSARDTPVRAYFSMTWTVDRRSDSSISCACTACMQRLQAAWCHNEQKPQSRLDDLEVQHAHRPSESDVVANIQRTNGILRSIATT